MLPSSARRHSMWFAVGFAIAGCGHTRRELATVPHHDNTAAAEVTATPAPESAEPRVVPLEGPFAEVEGRRIRFARETIEATLPPRTREIAEEALAQVGDYGIADDLYAPYEIARYEYENCALTVRVSSTLLRSPPDLFDDTLQSGALARIGGTLARTQDPSLLVVRRAESDLAVALLERDRFAMRLSMSVVPLREQDFDDDATNDRVDDETMEAAAALCETRGDVWLGALLSSVRDVRTEREAEPVASTVSIPGPDGRLYEVRVPDGHDVAVRDWYHGVEVELQPRAFFGESTCASVWITTANSPTGFEPAPASAPARTILGRRVRLADMGTEGPNDCARRVGVVPAGRDGVEWVVSLFGGDDALSPILDALASARRARRR